MNWFKRAFHVHDWVRVYNCTEEEFVPGMLPDSYKCEKCGFIVENKVIFAKGSSNTNGGK